MAKVSNLSALELSCLTDDDIFYIVDFEGKPVSKNITYKVLKQGIDRDIEKVQTIKDCSYNKGTKTIELSVGLSDGGTKVLSINMEELNIYHAGDGLSTLEGDDNTFIVDYSKVQRFGSYLSSNALDNLSGDWKYSKAKDTLSTEGYVISSSLGNIAYKNEISASEVCGYTDTTYSVTGSGLKMNETVISLDYSEICSSIDISSYSKTDTTYSAGDGLKLEGTTFSISSDYIKRDETNGKLTLSSFDDIKGSFKPSSDQYLTANALDSVSSDWNTAYSRTSADVGSIGYKNSLSTTDILGYKDTTYSNGFGLSAEGTKFGVDTDEIALKDHNHNNSYYQKNETSCVSELNSKFGEFKDLSKKNLSEIVDNNTIKVVGDKLSCVKEDEVYTAGRGLTLNNNQFSTSAEYTTYDYVAKNLSNDGYFVTFRDWGFKG